MFGCCSFEKKNVYDISMINFFLLPLVIFILFMKVAIAESVVVFNFTEEEFKSIKDMAIIMLQEWS